MICALLLHITTATDDVRLDRGHGYGLGFFQEKARNFWTAVKPGLVEVVRHGVVATSAYALYSAYQWYANPADPVHDTPRYDLALHASTTACNILVTAVTGLLAMTQCATKSSCFSPVLNVLGLSFLPSVNGQLAWTKLSPIGNNLPNVRTGHSACVIGTDIYIFGGVAGGGNYKNDLWQYSGSGNIWNLVNPISTLPTERAHHSASLIGSDIYIFGGSPGDFNDLWQYSISQNSWLLMSPTGTLPSKRHGHSASVLGADIYIFGGYDYGILNDLWRYNKQ